MLEPRMKDDDEFIRQLRNYVNGEDTPGAHGNRYEIFTMGIEDLWYNTYNADREYLNFIIGILLGV